MSTKHPGEVIEFYQKYPIADKDDAEHHEHDPVAKAAFILAVVAIAAAGPLVNDTIRQKVVRATAKEVAICNGDALRSTRDEQPDQTEIPVRLAGEDQCVTITVPYIASMEASATTIDGHTETVQSITPEYLTQSGYLSAETLTALERIMGADRGPVWIDPVDTPEDN